MKQRVNKLRIYTALKVAIAFIFSKRQVGVYEKSYTTEEIYISPQETGSQGNSST